ncbi:LysR family transcriptional regulator [Pseudomonas sp. CFBP 8770]|uniref:LysR family transcriptional regulator n=1 Tax=unclassified Pseudomonas TaxID=196821 RepID=UPI00177FBBE2|nr:MULTISPECIES: LysR substrate-binding domain-containing protein [unclassified Pseudomonas]MBD8473208.1 LysR family transcriptional regulator [Pseudomonas sp. CFBP 8773]MBD8646335.1 LysR family transcriptional regulator [Pseudomonas sp. CFBP 8770]
MNLNDLYYFFLVVKHGGFSAAERSSGLTKSALSRRITQLEERLQVRLINRNTRNFSPTPAGLTLYERTQLLVQEGEAAYACMATLTDHPSGQLRVLAPTLLAQLNLATLLPGFLKAYPEIKIVVEASDQSLEIIENGFDVAFRNNKDIDPSSGLIARTIAEIELIVVCSSDSPDIGELKAPSDLKKRRLTSSVLDRLEGAVEWTFIKDGESRTIKFQPSLFCLNPAVQLEAIKNGSLIGLIPSVLAEADIKNGSVLRILHEWQTETYKIYAVYPSRKNMNPALRAFLDYMYLHLPRQIAGI